MSRPRRPKRRLLGRTLAIVPAPGRRAVLPGALVPSAVLAVWTASWILMLRADLGGAALTDGLTLAVAAGGWAAGLLVRRGASPPAAALGVWSRSESRAALAAALSPLAAWLAGLFYLSLGGMPRLGGAGAALARLALGGAALGPAAFLAGRAAAASSAWAAAMDGTAATATTMALRAAAARLAGFALGGVAAAWLVLPVLGNRVTLWLACAVALLLAALLRSRAPRPAPAPEAEAREADTIRGAPRGAGAHERDSRGAGAPAGAAAMLPTPWLARAVADGGPALAAFVLTLAASACLRLLAPFAGQGPVLAAAVAALTLAGVSAGLGAASAGAPGRSAKAGSGAVALALAFEAVALALPLVFDTGPLRLALALPSSFAPASFVAACASRVVLAAPFVVLPSLTAGLVLGAAARAAAKVSATAPATATATAPATASAGPREPARFLAWAAAGAAAAWLVTPVLLPALSAPGCLRAAVLLAAVGALTLTIAGVRRGERNPPPLAALAAAAVAALLAVAAPGFSTALRQVDPTSGSLTAADLADPVRARDTLGRAQRGLAWQAEGREAAHALATATGDAWWADGRQVAHAVDDAATEIAGPLLAALRHGDGSVRNALVLGLGDGNAAGWLAGLPGLERVDVAENDAAQIELARRCADGNRGALGNPKVHVLRGDPREALAALDGRYDLLFAGPAAPGRWTSLVTAEALAAAADRLDERGVLAMWLPGGQVGAGVLFRIVANAAAVLPSVELWSGAHGDLLLVASQQPLDHDADRLRMRMAGEPLHRGLLAGLRADTLEALLAAYVARPAFATKAAERAAGRVVNDDRNDALWDVAGRGAHEGDGDGRGHDVVAAAQQSGDDRAELTGAAPDAAAVDRERVVRTTGRWKRSRKEPTPPGLAAMAVEAERLAEVGNEKALPLIEALAAPLPVEADALMARLRFRQRRLEETAGWVESACEALRREPFARTAAVESFLETATLLGAEDRALARRLLDALLRPFAAHAADEARRGAGLALSRMLDTGNRCLDVLAGYEPHVPWTRDFLTYRARCYEDAHHALAARAEADLAALTLAAGAAPAR